MSKYPRKGYLVVKLSSNGNSYQRKVHRLVGQLFVDNPNNLSCINHIDENKSNNIHTNLEWCNHQYNNTYGNRITKQSESLKTNWSQRKSKF